MPDYPASGNRNLLLYTNTPFAHINDGYYSPYYAYITTESVNNSAVYKTGPNDWSRLGINLGRHLVERGVVKAGDEVTYSVLAKTDQDTPIKITLFVRYKDSGSAQQVNGKPYDFILTKDWQKIEIPFTITEKMVSESTRVGTFSFEQTSKNETGKYIYYASNKIELGNTATPYSQAPEDLGWSATTLVPTQTQRYLWKFEYIYYSDGSVKVTQPVNISIAGADGTNGQTSHIHFAFADDATGGGFSLTTPKAYMGWYADFNESASNDPTKYKWSKWKGDEGAPGKPGADGKTSYFHMAYADSADGKTGFSFTESGQQYQGYYTDFTQANSTGPN